MRSMIRRLVRLCSLGLIGQSPKNRARAEQARLLKATRKAMR